MKDLQVAIIGGGVSGLTCAVALQKAGVRAEIFEAAAAFGEIGAGIGIGPNAVRILSKIGVLDEVLKRIDPTELTVRSYAFYLGLGNHEHVGTYKTTPADKAIGIHRATFLDALVASVDPHTAHFNKRCSSISESPTNPRRLFVHFLDGTTHEADVVLGADGVKSMVRDFVVDGKDRRIAFSNTVAYRGLIPYATLKAAGFKTNLVDHPACIIGPGKHLIIFPIKDAEIGSINVAAYSARYDIPIGESQSLPEGTSWVEEVTRDVVEKEYEGWGPDVSAVIKCMPEKPSKWSIHVVYPPLETYAKGRVALLGDAAHAMLPHLGAGAGQCIEDAYVITRLLSHPDINTTDLEAVLEAYSSIRQPRARMVWEGSHNAGAIYHFQGPSGASAECLTGDLQGTFQVQEAVWRHDIEDDLGRAFTMLRVSGAFQAS